MEWADGLWNEGRLEEIVIQRSNVEQALAEHTARLRVCLQQATGDSDGPEDGSDAWLLLNALIGNDTPVLVARFEQSGRWLAQQGGKLDVRLQGLQRYIDALAPGLKDLFGTQPEFLFEATSWLYQLQSSCVLALTRGYQSVVDQSAIERFTMTRQVEQRFMALQRINGISNSTMDLNQTLETIAQIVSEELHVQLCSIFFYDEMQRMLTLRATNGPRPLGGMHFTLRLGEGYSGWVADKGRPLLVNDAALDAHFSTEVRTYSAEYHGLMSVPIIYFG